MPVTLVEAEKVLGGVSNLDGTGECVERGERSRLRRMPFCTSPRPSLARTINQNRSARRWRPVLFADPGCASVHPSRLEKDQVFENRVEHGNQQVVLVLPSPRAVRLGGAEEAECRFRHCRGKQQQRVLARGEVCGEIKAAGRPRRRRKASPPGFSARLSIRCAGRDPAISSADRGARRRVMQRSEWWEQALNFPPAETVWQSRAALPEP